MEEIGRIGGELKKPSFESRITVEIHYEVPTLDYFCTSYVPAIYTIQYLYTPSAVVLDLVRQSFNKD